jgi:hypothetical protein
MALCTPKFHELVNCKTDFNFDTESNEAAPHPLAGNELVVGTSSTLGSKFKSPKSKMSNDENADNVDFFNHLFFSKTQNTCL